MDVSVMLEPLGDAGYRATALVPSPLVAEAPTRKEAVDRIRSLLNERFSRGELIQIQVPATSDNPWLALAGTWRDHPDLEEVVQNIETYRREVGANAERL